jgi:hypothetical protein
MEDNIRRGLSSDAARREAALKFGTRDSAKEGVRDQRGLPWLEACFKDLAYALRGMRKSPGLASPAIFVLGR